MFQSVSTVEERYKKFKQDNKFTYATSVGACFGWWKPAFLLPVIISSKSTPKLKTSDLIEYNPSMAYSGAIYPLSLQDKTRF